jgi:hypothetical protein
LTPRRPKKHRPPEGGRWIPDCLRELSANEPQRTVDALDPALFFLQVFPDVGDEVGVEHALIEANEKLAESG